MGILDLVFPKTCLECKKEGKYICDDCLRKVPHGGWITKYTLSLFRYKGVIRKAIIALKYKYSMDIARELAEICAKRLRANRIVLKAVLVPVPLHWYRQNLRGFNQSAEVGKEIAKKMGWKYIPDLLIKNKSTASQVELKGDERRKNLGGAFSLSSKYRLKGKSFSVILFDDVLTTGSTLKEAMKTLLNGGAGKVLSLTIAR